MNRLIVALACSVLAACGACSTTTPAAPEAGGFPEDRLTLEATTAHLRYLAADALMGRLPGTAGADSAAHYIATQFRRAGLVPAPGTEDFFQAVPFARTTPPTDGDVVLMGRTFQQGEQMVLVGGPALTVEAPMVFAGFGREADYDDLDVAGKVVAVRFGLPDNRGPRAAIGGVTAKRQRATARGAAAVVELFSGGMPWSTLSGFFNRPRSGLDEGAGLVPYFWIDDTGGDLADRLDAGADTGMASINTPGQGREAYVSPNVAGRVVGTDPDLRDEYVLMTAHYDHVGAGLNRRGATPADSIFNGARDNGMGTVALINAAQALAARPPRRSVLIVALTAEEQGLLGSRYYVQHPLVPLAQTVFCLNVDSGGYTDTGIVSVMGLTRTTAEDDLRAAAAAYGLDALADPAPEQNLFDRSDNVSFARAGVPAPTFSPGFRAFDAEIMKYYHQVADQADEHFDFAYLLLFTQAYTRAARNVADAAERPYWRPGDPYEAAGDALYGRQ